MTFTIEERDKINEIYARNCENLTPDEVRLLIAWESYHAAEQARVNEQISEIKRETDAKIESLGQQAADARNALDALVNAALARLERIDNEQA